MLAMSAKNIAAKWQMFICPVCLAYNSSVHAFTGFTPFYMFGREARLPIDLRFGTGDTSTLSPNEYVRCLQKVLEYVFDTAREHLGDTQGRQRHCTIRRYMASHSVQETRCGCTQLLFQRRVIKSYTTREWAHMF